MSQFSGISIALSGLNAATEELNVTSNNIANQTTTGYVRETVDVAPATPAAATMQMPSNGVGQGVTILGVTRNSDAYLDTQDLSAHANAANAAETESVLSQAQAAFGEPSANGISEQLSAFWSEWDAVAITPTDSSARATLLAKASGLATSFNETAQALAEVQQGASAQAVNDVSEINQDALAIAQLNQQIVNATAAGQSGGGLADQRDALAVRLAELTGASTRIESNGAMDVMIGNAAIVSGTSATSLSASTSGGTVSVTWGASGPPVAAGGQLAALMTAANTTLPSYQAQLDQSANALATVVNTQLAQGVSWSGSTSTPGVPLFVGSTAATLAVSPTITPDQIAAGSATGGPADGSNAQIIANFGNGSTVTIPGLGTVSGPDSFYRALVGPVGTDVSTATTQATAAATVQTNTDAARQSTEGVNLDEELAHMTEFPNASSANAKVLSAIDQTVQDLLAMVG